MLGAFFQIKALQALFLPKLPPNMPKFPLTCPERTKKHDLQIKNVCNFIWSAITVKSKHIQRFCEGIHTFCPNFPTDFARIFTISKVLGVRLCPASYTSVEKYYGSHGNRIKNM